MRTNGQGFGAARCTHALAVITSLAFLLMSVGGWYDAIIYAGGFIPARFAHPDLLDNAGLGLPVVPFLLTPISSSFLHGGWLHLVFNLLILIFCGRQVEMVLGGRLLLLLYGAGAYGAALGQWVLGPDVFAPMIGASGAISAILGAYALLFSNREVKALGPVPANVVRMLWLGAGWIGLQFLIGLASGMDSEALGTGGNGIAIGAHIGGFLVGMLLTRPLLRIRFGKTATHILH